MTQPKIEGVGHGVPRMLYASDGSNWYALKVRDSGILEVCSKSGDKIFGFESIVEEAVSNLNLPNLAGSVSGTAVPTGKVWKITNAVIRWDGTGATLLQIYAYGLADYIVIHQQVSPTSVRWYPWCGEIYLQAGDYMHADIVGNALNDDLYFRYAGVQMNAP